MENKEWPVIKERGSIEEQTNSDKMKSDKKVKGR